MKRRWDPLTISLILLVVAELLWKAKDYFQLWGDLGASPYFGRDLHGNFYCQLVAWKAGLWNLYSNAARDLWAADGKEIPPIPAMYPPFALWMHSPMLHLPDWNSWTRNYLWFSQACTVAALAILSWGFRRPLWFAALCLPLLLWSGPGLDTLFVGQLNSWMALTMVAFATFWIRGWKKSASLFLALGIASKLFPAIFLLLLARKREGKMILYTGAWLAVLHLPVLVWCGGPAFFVAFLSNLPNILKLQLAYDNMSIAGVLGQTFTPGDEWIWLCDAPLLGRLLGVLFSLLLLAATYRAYSSASNDTGRLGRELSLTFLAILLVPSLSWVYYGIYGIYAWLLFWLSCPERNRQRDALAISTLLVGLLCLFGGQIGGSPLRVYAMVTMMQYHLSFFLYLVSWFAIRRSLK